MRIVRSRTKQERLFKRQIMSAKSEHVDDVEREVDAAIAACGGDLREAIKALIVTNKLLWSELQTASTRVSSGYSRGRIRKSN